MMRRRFLGLCGKAAVATLLPVPSLAGLMAGDAAAGDGRVGVAPIGSLNLLNVHTGERLVCTYREQGRLLPDALAAIDHLLRDHRTDEMRPIDPALLDLMASLAGRLESTRPFRVFSGYRAPQTNEMLRRHSDGVAKRSYHMQGMAVDIELSGRTARQLQAAALAERAGGVGYYPRSGFVHVDTGPIRSW